MAYSIVALLELVVVSLLLRVFIRYWRLRYIPGPFTASLTDFWRAKKQRSGPTKPWLLALHRKYGPLVRIGPNTVSVSDAGSMKTIFTTKGDFPKADSYGGMKFYIKGKVVGSMIDIQDEGEFRKIKRAVGAAWIIKNLLDYEPDVDATFEKLRRRLQKYPTCNLYSILRLFQTDFLMAATFSEEGENLEAGRDVHGLTIAGSKRSRHWVQWQPLPGLERFIFHSPIWGRFIKRDLSWLRFGEVRVERRRADKSGNKKNDLLQRFVDASEKHPDVIQPDTIASLVYSVLSAGKDTTVAASAAMITYLFQHPEKLDRLMAELNDVAGRGKLSGPPKFTEVSTLPYLDAVYKETVRLNPFPPIIMERVVPSQGAVLAGQPIPGGTVVGCFAGIVHLDKTIFGEDADEFRPERWQTEDEEERLRMEKGFIGFGGGSRICLGRHIAELEVKKVVPGLLMSYDISHEDVSGVAVPSTVSQFSMMLTFTPKTKR